MASDQISSRCSVFSDTTPDLWHWDDIVRASANGESAAVIARQYGCSAESIAKIVALKTTPAHHRAIAVPAATAQRGLAPLPAALSADFSMVRLSQVITALHETYTKSTQVALDATEQARLSDLVAHARRLVSSLGRDLRDRSERRALPSITYPHNAFSRTTADLRAEPENGDVETVAADAGKPTTAAPQRVSLHAARRTAKPVAPAPSRLSLPLATARKTSGQPPLSLVRKGGLSAIRDTGSEHREPTPVSASTLHFATLPERNSAS